MSSPYKIVNVTPKTIRGDFTEKTGSPEIQAHDIKISMVVHDAETYSAWTYVFLETKRHDEKTWTQVDTSNLNPAGFVIHKDERHDYKLRVHSPRNISYTIKRGPESYNVPLEGEDLKQYNERVHEHEQTKLPRLQEETIKNIKAEAYRRITEIAPEHKQTNMIAHITALTALNGDISNWSDDDKQEAKQFKEIYSRIKAIRSASNQKEQEALQLTYDQLKNYDITTGWPE